MRGPYLPRGGEEGVRGRPGRALRGALAALILAALAGCATIPQKTNAQWLGVLPHGGTVYVSISVPPSLGVIKKALKDAGPAYGDISTLLDKTTRLYCSLTLVPDAVSRFAAAAVGNFPSTLMGWKLGSSGWEKESGPAGPWCSAAFPAAAKT